jgi:hypothetical protein
MAGCLEYAVKIALNGPVFPKHWDNFFYEYFNLREVGCSRYEAKKQAMKNTTWKFRL